MRKRHYLLETVTDHLPFKRPRAADALAAHYLRKLTDGVFKRLQYVAAVARRVQTHEGQHAQA